MAKTLLITTVFTIIFFISAIATATSDGFSRHLSPSKTGPIKREKLSHLHFYFQDTVRGSNQTSFQVAKSPETDMSKTNFGAVYVLDVPLTIGPEKKSRIVGRAQGMYASASQNGAVALLAMLNFAFLEGKFNGSSFGVLGRNEMFSAVREMPIVGGSGVFRFARGYVQAKTYYLNRTSTANKKRLSPRDAVVEYNVYVFHY